MKHVLTRQCFLKLILLNLFCCIAFNAFAVSPVEKIIKESKELKLLVEYFAKSKHNRDELYDFENVNVTVDGINVKIFYDEEGYLSRQLKRGPTHLSVAPQRVILDQNGKLISIVLVHLIYHDLDFFKQFKHLKVLALSGKAIIKDDSFIISDFPALEELYLSALDLKRIRVGTNLTKLRILSLERNHVDSIVGMKNLENLTRLNLYSNPLTMVPDLYILHRLKWIKIDSTKIVQLPSMLNFQDLEYLDASIKTLENIRDLDKLKKIKYIDLSGAEAIRSIKVYPSSLEYLRLGSTKLYSIPNIENLINLKELSLGGMGINKIEGLSSLVKLEKLNLRSNPIKIIEGLDNLVHLKELSLARTEIKKIEGLDRLVNLEKLDLSETKITKIEGLDSLTKLTHLDLSRTNIQRLEGINKLTSLIYADFTSSKITEVAPDAYDGLGNAWINLIRTPYYRNLEKNNFELWRKLAKEKKI